MINIITDEIFNKKEKRLKESDTNIHLSELLAVSAVNSLQYLPALFYLINIFY